MLAVQVVLGLVPATNGYTGVSSELSSVSVQLRVPPLLPWPACTNQSSPKFAALVSVAFWISFWIEMEPSEQVVWLWKSPATYLPGVGAAAAGFETVAIALAPRTAATATEIGFLLKP